MRRFDNEFNHFNSIVVESPHLPSPLIKTEMSSRIHPPGNVHISGLIWSGWMRDS